MKVQQPTHPRLLRLATHAHSHVRRTSVPLFKNVRKTTRAIGSAFLLGSPSGIILVTAGHVLDECLTSQLLQEGPAYFYIDETRRCPITGGHASVDGFDVGVIKLDHPLARLASKGMNRVMDIRSVRQDHPQGTADAFIILGTPQNRVRVNASEKQVDVFPTHMITFEHPESVYDSLKANRLEQLVVQFDDETINAEGKRVPRPQGMSGGPVWGAYPGVDGGWFYFVEGVQIEHHKGEKAVVCSRMPSVFIAIDRLARSSR